MLAGFCDRGLRNEPAHLAQRLVEELADLAWAKRTVEMPTMYGAEDAIATARELRRSLAGRLGPVTLIDVDDRGRMVAITIQHAMDRAELANFIYERVEP